MGADDSDIELKKFRSDERRFVVDLAKWLIAGIAAVISFYVIDVGRLRLEEFRSHSENQRLLLQAYLSATESVQPDVWKCKLRVLETYSDDERIRKWATAERQYIENYSEQDALYRETLKVASHLVHRTETSDPERKAARLRFEELYWADLPYARESKEVSEAVEFQEGADRSRGEVECSPPLELSRCLADSTLKRVEGSATEGGW